MGLFHFPVCMFPVWSLLKCVAPGLQNAEMVMAGWLKIYFSQKKIKIFGSIRWFRYFWGLWLLVMTHRNKMGLCVWGVRVKLVRKRTFPFESSQETEKLSQYTTKLNCNNSKTYLAQTRVGQRLLHLDHVWEKWQVFHPVNQKTHCDKMLRFNVN